MVQLLRIVIALGAAVASYATLIERNWFALRRHRIPCLPPGSEPLTILHISDLHLRAQQRRKRAFLDALADVQPDLLVATGDLLGDPASIEATIETVGPMPARLAKLLVLGSNDYYAPAPSNPLKYFRKKRKKRAGVPNPWREMVDGLKSQDWMLLNNETTSVGEIDVVGLDDAHIGRADFSVARARTDDRFRLAVAHSPDGIERLAELGYDLIVVGHTHGGQVCLPGVGALVTNSKLPRDMARGVHRIDGSWLHVCAGLGTSMYAPYRFACRPEACVLELVPRA